MHVIFLTDPVSALSCIKRQRLHHVLMQKLSYAYMACYFNTTYDTKGKEYTGEKRASNINRFVVNFVYEFFIHVTYHFVAQLLVIPLITFDYLLLETIIE